MKRLALIVPLLVSACAKPAPPTEPVKEEPQVDARYVALPTPLPAAPWAPPEVSRTKLESGVILWHVERKGAPLVSMHVVLETGSADDPQGKEGLTALTADMLDEGTAELGAQEIAAEFGHLATDFHSSTGLDYVLLSVDSLVENAERSLELTLDFLRAPTFPEREFKRVRDEYVANAISMRDSPVATLSSGLATALFNEGYGSRPNEGTESSLKNISLSDIKQRAGALSTPGAAHLVVVGNLTAEEARSIAERRLADFKLAESTESAPAEPGPSTQEPRKKARAWLIDSGKTSQSALAIARLAGDNSDPKYFQELVMNERLGGMFTSRINMNLREDKGYTYGSRSFFRRYKNAGYFGIFAQVKSEKTGASIDEIFKEIQLMCGGAPITPEENKMAVDGLLLGFPLKFESVSASGYEIARLPIYKRPSDFYETYSQNVFSINAATATDALKPYCDLAGYEVVIAGDRSLLEPELVKMGLELHFLDREGQPLKEEPTSSQ